MRIDGTEGAAPPPARMLSSLSLQSGPDTSRKTTIRSVRKRNAKPDGPALSDQNGTFGLCQPPLGATFFSTSGGPHVCGS